MARFDMLGAKTRNDSDGDTWLGVAATLAGGAVGALLWKKHPVLGLLNGFALAGNAARVATDDIPLRRAAENIGAHLVATAGSLALPRHPLIGYLAGAAGSNLFIRRSDSYLERLDETVLGRARSLLGDMGTGKAPSVKDDFVGPLSPQQLAELDRALTPAEQADVDKWQAAQATAMQKAEEDKPFVDPRTGKLSKVAVSYEGEEKPRPWWQWLLAAAGIVVAGGALYVGVSGGKVIR